MAYTQADLDTLDTAITAGELTIRHESGRMVTYRSMDELLQGRAHVAAILASQSGVARPYPRHQLADFSD